MNYNSFIPRTLIIFLQVFGTIFAVTGLAVYIAYMGQISDTIVSNETEAKMLVGIILSILVYFTWKAIYTCAVIISYMQQATDLEISNNRFIISALSLNLGGFVTPFILTSLPNIDVQSSINPRWFLSKVMGITSLVGAVLSLTTLFASLTTGAASLTGQEIFDPKTTTGILGIISLTIYLVILVFGALTTGLFYGNKKSLYSLEKENNTYGGTLKVISFIWMGIITVELVLVIWYALLRLIGSIVDLIRFMTQKQGFMAIFYFILSLLSLFLTLLYTFWVVKMTIATITGLWDKNGIHYQEYSELSKRSKEIRKK